MNATHQYQVSFAAPAAMMDDVQALCISLGNGSTLLFGNGAWKNGEGIIETEPVVYGSISVEDEVSVERMRVALLALLGRGGERCLWFTSQRVKGGLFATVTERSEQSRGDHTKRDTKAAG